MKDFNIIILGSDENSYGNARLIYDEYNVMPVLMCSRQLLATKYSKILTLVQIDSFDKKEVFIRSLKNKLIELHKIYKKVLVLPCADYYVELLVNNYNHFDGLIDNKFISRKLLDSFCSKDKFYELCQKHGLDYPKTFVACKEMRINALEHLNFDFPIVMKPENSNSYSYLHSKFVGKKKVYFFKTKDEYLKLINFMNKSNYNGKIILQEFIEGDDTTDRVINSYSDNNSNVVVSCLGQPILEEYAPEALGNYAAIITRYDEDLYKKVAKFLCEISYIGFSNIDMKYDKKNNRYVAFELNPRLGRSSFYANCADINMMKYLIDDTVYNKKFIPYFNSKQALWTNVNKKIIWNFVGDENLKIEAIDLFKSKSHKFTLKYKKDFSIKRNVMLKYFYKMKNKNIEKFFFKKDKLY